MIWIFLSTVVALAVYSPGFRQFLCYLAAVAVGGLGAMYLIGMMAR
jgi:hypothetical protein